MKREDAKRRIDELKAAIKKFDQSYYIKSAPLIPDYQYDELYGELKSLEEEYPELITKDSPTQKVNENTVRGFEKVNHQPRMYSLDNTYSDKELLSFVERIQKQTEGKSSFMVQPKIDGVAVSVIYRDNKLYMGLSRGNGITGDNITENIRTLLNLPHTLKTDMVSGELIVRGEVFFTKERFEELRTRFGFANARNAASGTLKLLDREKVKERGLSIRIHTVITPLSDTDEQTSTILSRAGMPVVEKRALAHNGDEIIEIKNSWENERFNLPYETDGIVIKVNELYLRDRIGFTNKSPRWAFAFKYKPQNAITRLISVDMQVGRTGIITPVANLDPVNLSGTTVKRATLHNFDEIERLGVEINDRVEIEKSGEIIPKIIRVAEKATSSPGVCIEKPGQCPSCGERTVSFEGEVAIRCINVNCPAQIEQSLIHFASKEGMNIDSMGPALIHQLIDRGLVESISDIYTLKKDDLLKLERMGNKSADNIISAIEESKNASLSAFINALGIRNVGEFLSKVIADRFCSIDELMQSNRDELTAINGIGKEVAQSIEMFFKNRKNRIEIQKLFELGLNVQSERKSDKLHSQKFVITGRMKHFTRDSIKRAITNNGGVVHNTVTADTDYLIAGEKAGSKLKKAKDMKIEIITENDFLNMLEKG